MERSSYSVRYLPLFYDDLSRIVSYIADELKNPNAALTLVNEIEKAIEARKPIAESFEIFNSNRKRKHPYYRIYVNNYIVYYVVIDEGEAGKVMEVRRILYKGMNQEEAVK